MSADAARPCRALVVDDEPPARALLASLVSAQPGLVLAGECADGAAAVAAIRDLAPDVVFLDIRMPGLSGFDVVERVGVDAMPLVVFVTAYDEHALRAFRAHAFDYLLKPVEAEQFARTAARAGARVTAERASDAAARLEAVLAALRGAQALDERLTVWEDGRAVLVRAGDIDRAVVEGNYVRLHVGAARHRMRETLGALEARLPSAQFVRLNRSVLVNVEQIREIQPYFHGDLAVVLRDGTVVVTGRTYRRRLRERFEADRRSRDLDR